MTWGRQLYFPSKGRHLIFSLEKSNGFSQVRIRDVGSRGQHAIYQITEAAACICKKT
jgi:hypothetical protein